MRRALLAVVLSGFAAGAWACANGLLANDDAGADGSTSDSSAGDAQPKDGGADVIKPGDAGCPDGTTLCGSSCFDLATDPQHCGACTTACSTADAGNPGDAGIITAVCNGGTCDVDCDGGLSKCGSQCFDEKNDPQNCGGCGAACDGGPCNQGTCCPPGDTICTGQCTDTTADDQNCGGCGKACDGGTCINSTCTVGSPYDVGNDVLFGSQSSHAPDYLLGSRITLTKAAKLLDFGLISTSSGAKVVMALYTESGGHPGTLVAYSSQVTLTNSNQKLTPNTQASLSATNYWIMAVYDTSASVGIDYNNSDEVDYISFTFGNTLPTTFPSPTTYTGQKFNYYLVVQ
jgi:hypothetical protein